jgi:hypothetical protein
MTRSQFALAVRAEEKWVENTRQLLSRRFSYSREAAVWLGLVRILNQDTGLTLTRSASLADEALAYVPGSGVVVVGKAGDDVAGISIDIDRYRSTAAASLSAALELGGERQRGRARAPMRGKTATLQRAAEYGVDLDLLRAGLRMSPRARLERLDENARFIAALRPAAAVKR